MPTSKTTSKQRGGKGAALGDRGSGEPGGLAGLVARRAAKWSVDGPDERLLRRQMPVWNLLMDHYFRMEIEGWHRLPPEQSLLVGVHSGELIDDGRVDRGACSGIGASAAERVLHRTAHDVLDGGAGPRRLLPRDGSDPADPRGNERGARREAMT